MEAFEALEAGDPRQVGRYRIVARLGAGGMGRVYLGRSPGGRAVAVKLVRPELVENGEFRRRFSREVAAARRVNGVFKLRAVDTDGHGRWKFSTRKNGLASPVVAGQVVCIGATDHHLYAVNADTGASRWRFDTGAPVYSSPAVADGVAFVSTENGYLYAVAT